MEKSGSWSQELSGFIKRQAGLQREVDTLRRLHHRVQEARSLASLCAEHPDAFQVLADAEQMHSLETLQHDISRLELQTICCGADDREGCVVEIHPGAGGEESADWAEMLANMYCRYASHHREWDVSRTGSEDIVLRIEGPFAFGFLRHEEGVHRLVRISPFDSEHRRHTSFASVTVFPLPREAGNINGNDGCQTAGVGLFSQSELRFDTFRAGGAGGQHVNKTESAVRVLHLPSGLSVVCQSERSQHRNKHIALEILAARLRRQRELAAVKRKADKVAALGENSFGNQIRSYVLHPYALVKDLRSGVVTGRTHDLLQGDRDELDRFILAQATTSASGLDLDDER